METAVTIAPASLISTKFWPVVRSSILLLSLTISCAAYAKDLDRLVRILSPAFLVQQGIAICTGGIELDQNEVALFSRANSYADYLKMRVSEGLSQNDVLFVLHGAADKAREQSIKIIRLLKSSPPAVENEKRMAWCKMNLTAVALKVLDTYRDQKESIETMIDQAKQ